MHRVQVHRAHRIEHYRVLGCVPCGEGGRGALARFSNESDKGDARIPLFVVRCFAQMIYAMATGRGTVRLRERNAPHE